MSQEKVNYNKEQKKNRKSQVRKKKFEYVLSMVIVVVIAVGIVGWIGYSTYSKVQQSAQENMEYTYTEADTSGLSDYLSSLSE